VWDTVKLHYLWALEIVAARKDAWPSKQVLDVHLKLPYLGKKFIHKAITPFDVDCHVVWPDVIVVALSLKQKLTSFI